MSSVNVSYSTVHCSVSNRYCYTFWRI